MYRSETSILVVPIYSVLVNAGIQLCAMIEQQPSTYPLPAPCFT